MVSKSMTSSLRRVSPPFALLLALSLLVAGCDLFGGNDENGEPSLEGTRVVVANGGNFSAQDGSLTLYDPTERTASTTDINVAFINSIKARDGRLYVVDNTSADNAGRITVYDASTLDRVAQIQNPRPPREIAFGAGDRAYVTNLSRFDANFTPQPSSVSILNLATGDVVDTVAVGRSPEGVVVADGRAFVANSAEGTLSVIDTRADVVESTLDLCEGPNETFLDAQGEVAVVCERSAEVVFLDPETLDIVDRASVPGPVGSANATQSTYYSNAGQVMIVINGSPFDDVADSYYEIDTEANAFVRETTVPATPRFAGIGAVAYDHLTQEVYLARLPVGDPFTTQGTTFVLDAQGTAVDSFDVGVSATHIEVLRNVEPTTP